MITKLDSLTDISTEFDKTLTSAQKMSWYYDNKNPASPVQPVMGGGRIKDWIGYDHSYVENPKIQVWYENPPTGQDFFRFFYTTTDNNKSISNLTWVSSIKIFMNDGSLKYKSYRISQKLNTNQPDMVLNHTGFTEAYHTDWRTIGDNVAYNIFLRDNIDSVVVDVLANTTLEFLPKIRRSLAW